MKCLPKNIITTKNVFEMTGFPIPDGAELHYGIIVEDIINGEDFISSGWALFNIPGCSDKIFTSYCDDGWVKCKLIDPIPEANDLSDYPITETWNILPEIVKSRFKEIYKNETNK